MSNDVVIFSVIGLASGGVIALVAMALVVTYRASGVLNFAQGGFVMVGGYGYYSLRTSLLWPAPAAVVGATLIAAVAGTLSYLIVLRPTRKSGPLIQVVSTLAIVVVLEASAALIYGTEFVLVPSWLPTRPLRLPGGIPVGEDRLSILAIVLVLSAGLWFAYRFTPFGRVTMAVAENVRATASLGHSPEAVAALNWGLGAALAGLAGTMIAPITVLTPAGLSELVIPGLAAALLGGFASFPFALAGALGIGVTESLLVRFVQVPGLSSTIPFVAVILVLVIRGRSLPLRSYLLTRLPPIGSGRIRWVPLTGFAALMAVLSLFVLPDTGNWQAGLAATFSVAIICLSVVVLTGYAGQLSLAQFVLAGVAALIAAELSLQVHVPFVVCLGCAVVLTTALGFVVGLPSLRTRGAVLGIVTLGLSYAIYAPLLNNVTLNGDTSGLLVGPPTVFGWSIDPLFFPNRYTFVCVMVFTAVAVAVANLRRGPAGRRLVAIRSNERAASALGISVYVVKLYAFSAAATVAAIGGVMFGFLQSAVLPDQFTPDSSLNLVVASVVGGVGMVGGSILAATLLPGTILDQVLNINGLNDYLPLVSGVLLLSFCERALVGCSR